MKKISTYFEKDPTDLGRVINQVNPENAWVSDEGVVATVKFDGTSCAIINGQLYKRYDAKRGKTAPEGAIPCQEPDSVTGHHPHWVLCNRENPGDKYHFEAFDKEDGILDGTYELCGPKIQGNPEKFPDHFLVRHGAQVLLLESLEFDYIREVLEAEDIEGIVFHHPHGMMCKIRKTDFGIKR